MRQVCLLFINIKCWTLEPHSNELVHQNQTSKKVFELSFCSTNIVQAALSALQLHYDSSEPCSNKRPPSSAHLNFSNKKLLRGIMNHSNSNIESQVESQVDSDWNMRHNKLSSTNRYEVLENYDEVEHEEIGTSTKSPT